jgi:hypothetical protein
MSHKYLTVTVLLFTALVGGSAQSQVVQGGMRGDRPYGISLAPTVIEADKPTVAQVTRSQKAMSRGETVDNFEGDYPFWSGEQALDVLRSTTLTVRDQEEWTNLWLRIGQNPPIDLPKNRHAIAILIGPRESEGYHVRITDMRRVGQGLHIVYLESKPLPAEVTAKKKKQTSPWLIKLIPQVEGTIRFFPSGK